MVVMLHGENPAIEARTREQGATEVLIKPFDLPALVDLAERLTSDTPTRGRLATRMASSL